MRCTQAPYRCTHFFRLYPVDFYSLGSVDDRKCSPSTLRTPHGINAPYPVLILHRCSHIVATVIAIQDIRVCKMQGLRGSACPAWTTHQCSSGMAGGLRFNPCSNSKQSPQPRRPNIFQMWPSSTGSPQLWRVPDTSRGMDYSGVIDSVDDKGKSSPLVAVSLFDNASKTFLRSRPLERHTAYHHGR